MDLDQVGDTRAGGLPRAVVVGGGIGGLAAALALGRAGWRVAVLERAARFAEVGAGIQIAPNGMAALEVLGVGERVRAIAVRMDELRFLDALTGRQVARVPLTGGYEGLFGHPYSVVHRAQLHALLLEACEAEPAVSLHAGCAAVEYVNEDGRASVVTASGERFSGQVVVGADGVRSALRRQMVGDGDPLVCGITVFRTIVPMEEVPKDLRALRSVTWWAGPGCHLVHYPIAGGRFLNLAPSKETGITEAFAAVPVSTERVLTELDVLGPAARRVLELGRDWHTWSMIDRRPTRVWTDGRVALLGDAAHPTLHYTAQGACQALEDAVSLANLLAARDPATVPEQLGRYSALRMERTARIQRLGRASIRFWHAAGPAADARNAALTAMSESELHGFLSWMHGPDAVRDLQPSPAVSVPASAGQRA